MINLDKFEIEVKCPRCGVYNEIFLRQVRIRSIIICRGCKGNIQLEDYMNEYRKTKRNIAKSVRELEDVLKI
jgi:phage FluMu protein Com